MGLLCFAKDDDVVDVHETVSRLHSCQDEFHESLEGRSSIFEPVRHSPELVKSFAGGEGRLFLVFIGQIHLPVAGRHV